MGNKNCCSDESAKTQQYTLPNNNQNKKNVNKFTIKGKKEVRILCIDGGGVRGIIPAMILQKIEEITKKHPSELFDMIVGTSLGGVISLLLAAPNKEKKPVMSTTEIVNMFINHSQNIFKKETLKQIESIRGMEDEKNRSNGLEDVLKKYLGETNLSESLVPLAITSFNLENYKPYIFRSWDKTEDFNMKFVGKAASAEPTYFELASGFSKEQKKFSCIDGAIIANNPTMIAWTEAKSLFPDANKFYFLSLGTGKCNTKINCEEVKDWSSLEWVQPALNIMMNGQSTLVHKQMKSIFPEESYCRLQTKLTDDLVELDNGNKENVEKLIENSNKFIKDNSAKIEKACNILLTPKEN